MDELTFRVIYVVVGVVFIAALLFSLARKLNRKVYLLPIGVGAAVLSVLVFLPGLVPALNQGALPLLYLLGGILTGYLVKDPLAGWTARFRAGSTAGTIVLAVLFVPNTYLVIGGETYGLFTNKLSDILAAIATAGGQAVTAEDLLYFLLGNYIFTGLFVVAFVGLGAILGGYLQRILKPAAKKEEAPAKPAAQPPSVS